MQAGRQVIDLADVQGAVDYLIEHEFVLFFEFRKFPPRQTPATVYYSTKNGCYAEYCGLGREGIDLKREDFHKAFKNYLSTPGYQRMGYLDSRGTKVTLTDRDNLVVKM
jgi:hypothetical protein